MKKWCVVVGIVVIGVASFPRSSSSLFGAGDIVFDPAALAEAIVQSGFLSEEVVLTTEQVAQNAEQIMQMYQQIKNQVVQIEHMVTNLRSLSDVIPFLRRLDFSLLQLSRTTGIPYRTPEILAEIFKRYPAFGGGYPGLPTLSTYTTALNAQNWQAAQDAMFGQAIQDQLVLDALDVQTQIEHSRAAVGNLSVTQASNELLGMQITQTLRLQQIEAMNGRIAASQALATAAKEDMERARQAWQAENWQSVASTAPGIQLR